MVVVGNGCVLGGDGGDSGVRVTSKRQWGFVLVGSEVHEEKW